MAFGGKVVRASEIKVGDEMAERDGYLWTVKAVENRGRTIVVTLCSDFSSFREHWSTGPGIKKTLRAGDRYRIIPKEGCES